MTTPRLPILNLQDAARFSAVPSDAARPAVRLQRGPFRDRPDVWSLIPVEFALSLPSQKTLFGEPEDWLANELERHRATPRIVMLGTHVARLGRDDSLPTNLATIIPEIARHGITAWICTRAPIAPDVLDVLVQHRERVRVTIGLPTLDPSLVQAIDPTAATPIAAQDTIAALVGHGIAVDAALEPLLPDLTDAGGELRLMLSMLANLGVDHITTGYLVLHEGDTERVRTAFDPEDADTVLAAYDDGITMRDGKTTARFLSKSRRQRGYATLIAQAAELGVTVRVSALSNPDFRTERAESPRPRRSLQERFRDRLGN